MAPASRFSPPENESSMAGRSTDRVDAPAVEAGATPPLPARATSAAGPPATVVGAAPAGPPSHCGRLPSEVMGADEPVTAAELPWPPSTANAPLPSAIRRDTGHRGVANHVSARRATGTRTAPSTATCPRQPTTWGLLTLHFSHLRRCWWVLWWGHGGGGQPGAAVECPRMCPNQRQSSPTCSVGGTVGHVRDRALPVPPLCAAQCDRLGCGWSGLRRHPGGPRWHEDALAAPCGVWRPRRWWRGWH